MSDYYKARNLGGGGGGCIIPRPSVSRMNNVIVSDRYDRYVRVSDSGPPTQYYFEKILNDITCVNSFYLFLPTLNFELQI